MSFCCCCCCFVPDFSLGVGVSVVDVTVFVVTVVDVVACVVAVVFVDADVVAAVVDIVTAKPASFSSPRESFFRDISTSFSP